MILQLIVAVVGLLMYVLATNPKINEIGRILFWTGTLTFLFGAHFPILGH
jgi:hypothetical protein